MITANSISIAIQIGTLVGMLFAVYLYFKRPQEKSELNDAVFTSEMKALADKFDIRFQDMKDGVVKVMQNDMQEVKSDLREHVKNQIIYERENTASITKLTTMLEERLPKK